MLAGVIELVKKILLQKRELYISRERNCVDLCHFLSKAFRSYEEEMTHMLPPASSMLLLGLWCFFILELV